MRYFNGELRLFENDLAAGGFGLDWGHTRQYSNRLSTDFDFGNGYNWLVTQWSQAVHGTNGSVSIMRGTGKALWFDLVGGSYVGRYGSKHRLTKSPKSTCLPHLTATYGGSTTLPKGPIPKGFQEPHHSRRTTGHRRKLPRRAPPKYNGATSPAAARPPNRLSTTTPKAHGDLDNLQYVTLRRKVDGGGWTNIRRVEYAYYGENELYGSLGDLKTVKHQSPDGESWGTEGTSTTLLPGRRLLRRVPAPARPAVWSAAASSTA